MSDADGMKDIWSMYMEKLLNVENDWMVKWIVLILWVPVVSFWKKTLQHL